MFQLYPKRVHCEKPSGAVLAFIATYAVKANALDAAAQSALRDAITELRELRFAAHCR